MDSLFGRLTPVLPKFKYHPSPFASGAFVDSMTPCKCCGVVRGYGAEHFFWADDDFCLICPWCIADGQAAAKFGIAFNNGSFGDSWGEPFQLPWQTTDEIIYRTPRIVKACQEATWWVHCGDAAEYLRTIDDRVCFRCRVCGKKHGYVDLV